MSDEIIRDLKEEREKLLRELNEAKKRLNLNPGSRNSINIGLREMELKKIEGKLESMGVKIESPSRKWISQEEADQMVDRAVKKMYSK